MYTDFGKLILLNKTKARVAMDFSFTVIFGTMCTFLYVRTVIQATLSKHVMHILQRNNAHRWISKVLPCRPRHPLYFTLRHPLYFALNRFLTELCCMFQTLILCLWSCIKQGSVFSPVIGYYSKQDRGNYKRMWCEFIEFIHYFFIIFEVFLFFAG